MYLKMLIVDNFVEINNLKEITDPIYLEHGKPSPNGLFSYEIFGVSQEDRSTIWGYIDLHERFLHPLAAINFRRYSKNFENIICGLKTYRFENGEFIEDPNGDTGIDFLYKNYDDIKWRETESVSSIERITFLKQGKDKLFLTKFPVLPPFYRDINDNSEMGVPIVNKLYKKLISLSLALKKKSSFSFFGDLTRGNIQNTLIDIYDHYIGMLKGKNGLLRRFVMGRNIDYGTWLVMSAPKIDANKYTEMDVNFDYTGYPMDALIAEFKPFVFTAVKQFFENEFMRSGKYPAVDKHGKTVYLTLKNPELVFTDEYITKKIDGFINGKSTRFEPIMVPDNLENIKCYMALTGRFAASEDIINRPLTWTDVLYITISRVVKDRFCMTSRYPIEHMYSVMYTKPRPMSTIKTLKNVEIDNIIYKSYPLVEVGEDSSNSFINTVSPCNVYLKGMGGDYDGDSVPCRGVFTDEANDDARKFMRDKKNFLDLVGKNIRSTERDFIQLIYSLSKGTNKVKLDDPN